MDLNKLKKELKDFAEERNWQGFHAPKNLVMAMNVEVAELMEHFQWLTEEQSENLDPKTLDEVQYEVADVFIYLVRLADRLDVDLDTVVVEKIKRNAAKYPADKCQGSAAKYTEYE